MTMTGTPSLSLEAIATTSLPIQSLNDMPKEYSSIEIILFGIASVIITIIMYLRGKDGDVKIACCCSRFNDVAEETPV